MKRTITITPTTRKRFLDKRFLIPVITILVMLGAGLTGQAVAGNLSDIKVPVAPGTGVIGEADVTTSQALTIIDGSVTGANAGRVIINDDNTAFIAPAEVYTGDRFAINLALGNDSENPVEAQITVLTPDGISVKVKGSDDVSGVVRCGPDSWALRMKANQGNEDADLIVIVSVSDVIPAGDYTIRCTIEPITFPQEVK